MRAAKWSGPTREMLRQWLARETAFAGRPADDSRFYDFVFAVWRDERGVWDEAVAREAIRSHARELHGDWSEAELEAHACRYAEVGTTIIGCLSRRSPGGPAPAPPSPGAR